MNLKTLFLIAPQIFNKISIKNVFFYLLYIFRNHKVFHCWLLVHLFLLFTKISNWNNFFLNILFYFSLKRIYGHQKKTIVHDIAFLEQSVFWMDFIFFACFWSFHTIFSEVQKKLFKSTSSSKYIARLFDVFWFLSNKLFGSLIRLENVSSKDLAVILKISPRLLFFVFFVWLINHTLELR